MSDTNNNATYISPLDDTIIYDNYVNMDLIAKKFSTVSFRSPVNDLINVKIEGALEYPGTYVLRADSSLEDLYRIIGNFRIDAFLDGIVLKRESVKERQLKAIESSDRALNQAILSSAQKGSDVDDILRITALVDSIEPENLGRIAGNFSPLSQSLQDIKLIDGDVLVVPKSSNVVNIIGAVLNPLAFEITNKISVQSAITAAGGLQSYADKRRIYVIKANGLVKKPGRNIFQGDSKLQPGDTVVVPRKISGNTTAQGLAPIIQIISDLSFSAAALDNLTSN